jgi:flagellar biosynthetic protein FliR
MGLNFASFFDLTLNTQSSAVAQFFGQLTSLLFVVLNGHLMVLMAVNRSFKSFPIEENFLEALGKMNIYKLGTDLFASALWIALPMIGVLLFTNFALGIISRIAPQMNIFSIGFPITLAVGLVGIAFTLPMLDQPFIALMARVIEIFGGG